MSLLSESSPKHCANKGGHHLKHLCLKKRLIYTLSTVVSSILLILLLLYFILHPSTPHFHLQDTTLSDLSLSGPNYPLLNSTIRFTLVSHNPNSKVGVYYEDMRACAVYKGEVITTCSALPSFYQASRETKLMSASLEGTGMPVAASIGYEVGRDQNAGRFSFSIRVDGKLKWRFGGWVTGNSRFDVSCVTVVGFRGTATATAGAALQGTDCSTNV